MRSGRAGGAMEAGTDLGMHWACLNTLYYEIDGAWWGGRGA